MLLINRILETSGKMFLYAQKKLRAHRWVSHYENLQLVPLTDLQCRNIKEYYEKWSHYIPRYLRKHTYLFNAFYYNSNGIFSSKYIPDDLYYCAVDPFYNDWKAAKYLDNKCLYKLLFPDVLQPETIAMRCNETWIFDNECVDNNTALSRLENCQCNEIVIKVATDSEGGHGVFFCKCGKAEEITNITKQIKGDIVIQKPLKQHEVLSGIFKNSINTIRIISMLRNNEVKIYSSILRMGTGESRVDNASSGGITCGIMEDGSLKEVAYSANGEKYKNHPTTGVCFSKIKIPAFADCRRTVERLHKMIPWFRLVSWDIMINEDGNPVLIEANMKYGELDFHQLNNGPLFGDDTDSVLDEVFNVASSCRK